MRPDDGSAYGWLIAVLIGLVALLAYAIITLYKRNNDLQDGREATIEKTFNVIQASTGVQQQVEERLGNIETEQRVQTTLLQTFINKGNG